MICVTAHSADLVYTICLVLVEGLVIALEPDVGVTPNLRALHFILLLEADKPLVYDERIRSCSHRWRKLGILLLHACTPAASCRGVPSQGMPSGIFHVSKVFAAQDLTIITCRGSYAVPVHHCFRQVVSHESSVPRGEVVHA